MIRTKSDGSQYSNQRLEAGDCIGWDQEGQTFSAWNHGHPSEKTIDWDNGDDKNLQYLNLKQAEGILFRLIPSLLGMHAVSMKKEYPSYDACILLVEKQAKKPSDPSSGPKYH